MGSETSKPEIMESSEKSSVKSSSGENPKTHSEESEEFKRMTTSS